MPSNESPAFDVLRAKENDLWDWAVKNATVAHAATYLRDETLKALQKPGTPEMGRADLARARVEGARDVLERCAKAMAERCASSRSGSACEYWSRVAEHVRDYLDREYPAPKPAEVVLSDGSVVRDVSDGLSRLIQRDGGDKWHVLAWTGVLRETDTGADFDALKAFAATPTEDTTDGR